MSETLSSTAPAAGDGSASADRRSRLPGRRALWFAFAGTPIAWSLNLLLGYSVQAAACNSGRWGSVLGVSSGKAIPLLLSIVAAAVGVAGVIVAYRCWRITGTGEENPEATVPPDVGRSWFMSYGGLVSSILFLLGIVLTGIVELTLPACGTL